MEICAKKRLEDWAIACLTVCLCPFVVWAICYIGRFIGFSSFDYKFWILMVFALCVAGFGSHMSGQLVSYAQKCVHSQKRIIKFQSESVDCHCRNDKTSIPLLNIVVNINITRTLNIIRNYIIVHWQPIYCISSFQTKRNKNAVIERDKIYKAIRSTVVKLYKNPELILSRKNYGKDTILFIVFKAAIELKLLPKWPTYKMAREILADTALMGNRNSFYNMLQKFQETKKEEKDGKAKTPQKPKNPNKDCSAGVIELVSNMLRDELMEG